MASAGLLGAPVYLRNNDGVSVYHGYLIVEVIDFILRRWGVVAAAVPARIVMDGIADIAARDGI